MVRSQEIRNSTAVQRSQAQAQRSVIVVPPMNINLVAYIVTGVLALLAIYAVMGNALSWVGSKIDDLRYGTPRTYQIQAVVGHNDSVDSPSHFMAMNLNRQIVVIQIPGGDPAKVRTLAGPYLVGANEDKTTVFLRVEDLNHDKSPDLILSVKNEEIVYINRDGTFQPLSAEERSQLNIGK